MIMWTMNYISADIPRIHTDVNFDVNLTSFCDHLKFAELSNHVLAK